MAKFDRASLLLVLCVTVIISLWMPISQCSAEPVKCVADTECDACSKLAIQLYDEVEDKLAEIFSRKETPAAEIIEIATNLINENAENVCNRKRKDVEECGPECKFCRKVLPGFDTGVATYLYNNYRDVHNFIKYVCKDLAEACGKPPQPFKDDRKQWPTKVKNKAKDAYHKVKNKAKDAGKSFLGWLNRRWPSKSKTVTDEHEHEHEHEHEL
ncbi:uncharacterized protein LOC111385742 [Olea europaea var. sylvestris]|uniref:Saposin B-type domain-containing protein n=1 Tax=Olea europaea subsp. europaea TaxID=158383 RepID=A0A8S0U017_OLEEU|nr:uncharacterized protein LOC111385742 [Olea europaea var. sylvestris]CAA3012015.1 Hypothetical predicted protein [Olea europaea subsp. europaea]